MTWAEVPKENMPTDNEILGISIFAVSWLPIFPDPFFHEKRVNFWVWLQRELYEFFYGEKAKIILGIKQHMPQIEQFVTNYLETTSEFSFSVDLGCGIGSFGPLLKQNTKYLVGVDVDSYFLSIAELQKTYDELVNIDVSYYPIPPEADSVFLFEFIEHLPKERGVALLNSLYSKFVMVSTPLIINPNNPLHISLWSIADFKNLGFNEIYTLENIPYGNIIAIRRNKNG